MGTGYYFVNPAKQEYFNPALSGGYLRKKNLFKGGLQVYALQYLFDAPSLRVPAAFCWWGDPLRVVSEHDWIYPDEPGGTPGDRQFSRESFEITRFTDITFPLSHVLMEENPDFADQYIAESHIHTDHLVAAVNHFYQCRSPHIEEALIKHLGKNWQSRYKKVLEGTGE